jgi:hypothetical protein
VKISDVRTICTAPEGIRLVVVKVELLHDVHERVPPIQAIGLARELEPYHLFFLEGPFAPEDPLNGGWPPVRRLDGTVIRP